MERYQKKAIIQDLNKKMVFLAGPRQTGKTYLAKEIAKSFLSPVYLNYDNSEDKKILNFPTKYDWKYPSKKEYLHKGLQKFIETYKQKGITSIAFPLLGAQKGGIDSNESLEIMISYLKNCDIDIEIWHFDPTAKDDLYEEFKSIFYEIDDQTIKSESGIRIDIVKKIRTALDNPKINSLSGLLTVKGVGDTSLEKMFKYILNYKKNSVNLLSFIDN